MEDNKKTNLSDDVLDKVAGGRTVMHFGASATQDDTVPVIRPDQLHLYARTEEDENTNMYPGTVGRL